MKKILVSLGVAAMAFGAASSALAAGNGVTGDRVQSADRGGTNTSVRARTSTTSVTTNQTASLSNTLTTNCNSGGNRIGSVFGDVKGTKITTGESKCGSDVKNTVNKADVKVTAATTVASEGNGPTTDQWADRGGDNIDTEVVADAATVNNNSNVGATNTQTSDSNTGDNETESMFGDVAQGEIIAGPVNGANMLWQDFNTLMLTVLR